uniref:Battenin n=1 Tax=Meloidogyne hapla TaxID=6305 RepID=A0A1I8BGZ5_MELHA
MNILLANTSQKLVIQITFFAAIVGGIMCDLKYGRYGYFDFFALFLLSYGCGCIKAVLAAYGADQFKPLNVTQIGYYFALFYLLEQITIIFGIYLLPIIKLILFGTANYFYKFLPQNKNQNIFIKSFKIIKQSLINKYRRKPLITSTKQSKPKYLLEYFLIDHNCQRDKECDFGRKNICEQTKFVGELQTIIEIFFVLLPLSIFWALRTKLISINISQIQNVDSKLPFIGQLPFLPSDQLCCLLQPFFVILCLPLFYIFIFKSSSISQYLSLNTYLRRIFIGIFLCSLACFCSANIQKLLLSNNNNLFIKSTEDFTLIKLFNLFPSKCSFSISKINSKEDFIIIEANNSNIFSLKSEDLNNGYVDLLFRFNG